VSPAKTVDPIKIPFWLLALVISTNHVLLDEGPNPSREMAILRAKMGKPL